jgi:hypothetical protein
MTKEYFITETQRVEVIKALDTLAGTRQLANFFELALTQQVIQPKIEENQEAKKKSEPQTAKSVESKAKVKK